MADHIFIDTSVILAIAIGIAFLARLFKQPLLVSYIITGIVCGPLFLKLISVDDPFYGTFAKFGVILLLFLVGLGLNFEYLKQVGKVAVIAGIAQVFITGLIGVALLANMHFDWSSAAFLGVAITFSSTIIITKLLSDKREHMTVYGRHTIALMLVQDLVAIGIMIFLPSMGHEAPVAAFTGLFLKIVIILALIYFFSRILLPAVLEKVADSTEFLLIFTLAWCFAVAGLSAWSGLSLEVGALVAGLSLGSSKFRTEIQSRVKPLRDFFIALFFIILGSQMNLSDISAALLPALFLSVFVLVGNPLILYFLFRRLKFTRKVSFLVGLTAAQVSEFGFVFLFLANELDYVSHFTLAVFTLTALITIFISTYLITYNHRIYAALKPLFDSFGRDRHAEHEISTQTYQAIVFGYHRLGWKLCEALKEMETPFAVVDFDPMAAKKLEARDIPFFFGDAGETDFLEELPLEHAKLVISTLPSAEEQITLIEYVRRVNSRAIIIANLSHSKFLDDLYRAGADYIMMPHLLSGQWMAEILKKNHWTRKTFEKLTAIQREELKLKFTLGENSGNLEIAK